jgi:hypothetical protein
MEVNSIIVTGIYFVLRIRYEEKDGVNNRDSQAKSRASLERYLHVKLFNYPVL